MKDANVSQLSELRVFANASSSYGEEMARLCHSGINEGDEAYRAAEYLRPVETKQSFIPSATT